MTTLIVWILLAGLSYGVTIDDDKPSASKQIKVALLSCVLFSLFLGLALKEHLDNVKAIRKELEKMNKPKRESKV